MVASMPSVNGTCQKRSHILRALPPLRLTISPQTSTAPQRSFSLAPLPFAQVRRLHVAGQIFGQRRVPRVVTGGSAASDDAQTPRPCLAREAI